MSDNDDQADRSIAVLRYLVEQVVEYPDEVEIEVEGDGDHLTLIASVDDDDMGRVIGKRGRVAQAIRTVVRAAAARDGITVDIEFED